MFFNDGGTLGTYDTNNSIFPWFVEMSGYGKFNEVSYKNEQVDNNIITTAVNNVSTTTKKLTLMACSTSMTVNMNILMPSNCLNNIFEFRVITPQPITFSCTAQGAIIIDTNNNQQRTITST
jgi:lactam utilization protein B